MDHTYLTDLVIKAQHGSSNAFAELYTATCRKQYAYACYSLAGGDEPPDEQLAQKALREIYTAVLHRLSALKDPELFPAWIARINYQTCCDLGTADQNLPSGVLQLPLTESQVVLMHDCQKLSLRDCSDILNMRDRLAKRYLKAGRKHLEGTEL